MLDYSALRAVSAVVQTGSFEKAAGVLNVTPSAVSQRVKQLEERLGAVLIARGNPCTATKQGEWLCRHMENVGMLEGELFKHLPALVDPAEPRQRTTLHIATNADSLETWFVAAASKFASRSDYLLNIAVEDQDHTAEWLARGRVIAAVTSLEKPISGVSAHISRRASLSCDGEPRLRFPIFCTGRHPGSDQQCAGVDLQPEGQAAKPVDTSDARRRPSSSDPLAAIHAEFCRRQPFRHGMGMNPIQNVREHLESGRLVELVPNTPLDIPLYWQINRLAADRLADLTREVTTVAKRRLRV